MHLFFITRGMKQQTDTFISDLMAQSYQFKRLNIKTNTYEYPFIQGNLKPIQLWDYAFPKEELDVVLATVKPSNETKGNLSHLLKYKILMRSLLKAKQIPEYNRDGPQRIMGPSPDVQRIGIGIKDDIDGDFPDGYRSEML